MNHINLRRPYFSFTIINEWRNERIDEIFNNWKIRLEGWVWLIWFEFLINELSIDECDYHTLFLSQAIFIIDLHSFSFYWKLSFPFIITKFDRLCHQEQIIVPWKYLEYPGLDRICGSRSIRVRFVPILTSPVQPVNKHS